MKKIFISTPLDESIVLPKDVTHHILHVFRHNIEKPITVTGSDNRCGIYQINDEINGLAQASLIEYIDSPTSMHRTILVQSYLKGEKLEWVLQKATELNVDTVYLVPTSNCVAKYDAKNYSQNIVVGKRLCWKLLNNAGAHSYRRSLWVSHFLMY